MSFESFPSQLAKDSPLDIRFIELMPFDDNNWSTKKMVSYMEMKSRLQEAVELLSIEFVSER